MKIIVPMAGMGKRMRPHTLTIPKPLIRIAGKPIVQRLVEDIVKISSEPIDEIAFIIGDFGQEVEESLLEIAKKLGTTGRIYYQNEPLGTAHAILCAADSLEGKVTIAFADTLFKADFKYQEHHDGIIWVHQVKDPRAFGVVKTDKEDIITDFVEKPENFVSDLAIIGIYYFKDGANLRTELQYLIDKNIAKDGEYQVTDALRNMMDKGLRFTTGRVDEWLDCGNKNATVFANQRILDVSNDNMISPSSETKNTIIVKPCFIGDNVVIENSIIGPHVSVGENTHIKDSIISNSIIQNNSDIININIDNSMIGSYVSYKGNVRDVSIGDYTLLS